MPIRYEWADANHQVMNIYLDPPWTWQEYRESCDQAFNEVRQISGPTATIVDVSQVKSLPRGDILGHLKYVESTMPPNVCASVIVGAPYIVTSFMNVLVRLRPNAKRIALFAATMDEARELVAHRFEEVSLEPSDYAAGE